MSTVSDLRSPARSEDARDRRSAEAALGWRWTLLSATGFLLAFSLLQTTDAGPTTSLVLAWRGEAWRWQAASLLVPLAAAPLVLAPLAAGTRPARQRQSVLSAGLLLVYAAALWATDPGGLAWALAAYLALLALLPVAILLDGEHGRAIVLTPSWTGGSRVLVVGVLAYGAAAATVVALPPLAVGLLGLLVGTPLALTDASVGGASAERRGRTALVLAGLGLVLLATGSVAWCLASPLVYLAAPPALLGLAVALGLPQRTDEATAEPMAGGRRARRLAAIVCLGLCLILAARALEWLGTGLCG